MGAYNDMDRAFAGMAQGMNNRYETWKAAEDIGFGMPVFVYEDDDVNAYTYKNDVEEITFDADLVVSNVITITPTINGVAGSAIVVNFDIDHDTTMDAIVTALEAAYSGSSVTLTDATDNRVFEFFYKGNEVSLAVVVTAGDSQAGVTADVGTNQIFAGIAKYTAKAENSGTKQYAQYDAMNVLVDGRISVESGGTVKANTAPYVLVSGADIGKFGASGYNVGGFYRTSGVDGDIVDVEVNEMKNDAASI